MTTNSTASDSSSARPLVLTVVILIVVFAAVGAWRFARSSNARAAGGGVRAIKVAALAVHPESVPQSLEAVGSLEAVQQVTLAPEVAGRVVAIQFVAGSHVEKGAELVHLYDDPEQADHAVALAAENFAKLQYDRSEQLKPSGAESQLEFQQHSSQLDQAHAATQQTAARLYQKTIRAPFAGRIGIRRVNLGQYINAGEAIATLAALEQLYVNFTLPQQDVSQFAVGGRVTVRSDAYPNRNFEARISAIDPVVGSDSRNVSVQATLPNTEELLRPGMYVTAAVELPTRKGVLLVPVTAVNPSASGDTVYVIREGKAVLLPVVAGQRIGNRAVIESGLTDGDVVITDGELRVQPGAAVTVITSTAPSG